MRSLGILLVALIAGSCTEGSITELVVAIDSNLSVAQAPTIAFEITTPTGTRSQRFSRDTHPLPQTLSIVSSNADAQVSISVSAESPGGTAIASASAITGFVRDEKRLVELFLDARCEGVRCEAEQTCELGECRSAARAPDSLPAWGGTLTRRDAGVPDAPDDTGSDACEPIDPCGAICGVFEDGCGRRVACECRMGDVCDDGVCTSCLFDENCVDGTVCNDGACVDGCRRDGDCERGDVCVRGVCTTPLCSSDDECPDLQVCTDAGCLNCDEDGDGFTSDVGACAALPGLKDCNDDDTTLVPGLVECGSMSRSCAGGGFTSSAEYVSYSAQPAVLVGRAVGRERRPQSLGVHFVRPDVVGALFLATADSRVHVAEVSETGVRDRVAFPSEATFFRSSHVDDEVYVVVADDSLSPQVRLLGDPDASFFSNSTTDLFDIGGSPPWIAGTYRLLPDRLNFRSISRPSGNLSRNSVPDDDGWVGAATELVVADRSMSSYVAKGFSDMGNTPTTFETVGTRDGPLRVVGSNRRALVFLPRRQEIHLTLVQTISCTLDGSCVRSASIRAPIDSSQAYSVTPIDNSLARTPVVIASAPEDTMEVSGRFFSRALDGASFPILQDADVPRAITGVLGIELAANESDNQIEIAAAVMLDDGSVWVRRMRVCRAP